VNWLLLLPVCGLAGFLAGLLGIGGGILLVPVFLEFFRWHGYPPLYVQTAFGTSKAVILISTLGAVREQVRMDRVAWPAVRRMAPGVLVGAVLGASVASWLPGAWLRRIFAGWLAVTAWFMARRERPASPETRGAPLPSWWLLPGGLGIGVFASLLGLGGGVLAVPLLHRGFRYPLHQAMATSAGVMLFTASAGATTYAVAGLVRGNPIPGTVGFVHVGVLALGGVGALVGSRFGVRVAAGMEATALRRGFAFLLALVAVQVLLR
jgi:uncharacterized membrane protein YfcA